MIRFAAIFLAPFFLTQSLSAEIIFDDFEGTEAGLDWLIADGTADVVNAADESRLPATAPFDMGSRVYRLGTDENTDGVHLSLAGEPVDDMVVESWVYCEGNDGPIKRAGYQGIVARASMSGTVNMVRLAWDPDHQESGDVGDGWVKLQAYNGVEWDYLGIDFSTFGAATNGYFLNGTTWPSGWRKFKLSVIGDTVSAYVDDMDVPVVTGTLNNALRKGSGGFYAFSSNDYAAYFDDFSSEFTPPPPSDLDVLISGGTVYRDGNSQGELADVGIIDDRIVLIGDAEGMSAQLEIDASGLLVVPGFIDTHTHADGGGSRQDYLVQGVTTIVTGNCGSSPRISSIASTYDNLAGTLGPNYIGLIGHNQLRSEAGFSGSTPTTNQMNHMKNNIDQAMSAGAFGLSTGLIYNSGFNSTTEEVVELAQTAAASGGIYSSHIRSETEGVLEAVEEALTIGKNSGARVLISHVKCAGPSSWGLSDEYLALVDQAVAEGLDVWMDQYPYPASQTTINAIIPDWAENNWANAIASQRPELEEGIRELIAGRGGADRIYMISGPFPRRYLDEVAASLSKSPEDVIIEDIGSGGANAIYFMMTEEDLQVFIQHPRVMMGSDGPTGAHPRGRGTFPRLWGHYGRELGFFDHQVCVEKTSTMAANHFQLVNQNRGKIEEGFFADITILNPDTIIDRATFDSPTSSPLGIRAVFVNGVLAVNNGSATGALAGRVLRSTDSKAIPSASWILN